MDIFDFDSDSDSEFEGFGPVPNDGTDDNNLSDIDLSDVSSVSSDEDDNEVDDFEFDEPIWTNSSFVNVDVDEFEEISGPQLPPDFDTARAMPLDYFQLFFSETVIRDITKNTNRYAAFLIAEKQRANPGYTNTLWYPVDEAEMKAFLGLNVIFGMSKLPNIRSYWSTDPFIGNNGIKKVMTSKRFETISEALHISDREREIPQGQPGYDQLAKVRPLLKKFGKSFPTFMKPFKEQTIDEGMVAFKGRVKYLQYLPMKPVKRGIKMWLRADALSGYIQQMDVYLGSREKQGQRKSKNGVYFDVVEKLCKPLFFKNHHVYFDNLYTSIPLLVHLLHNGVYACGTIRSNKKYLPAIVARPPKMDRGEMKCFQDTNFSNLTCCVWQDTNQVRFASTLNQPNNVHQATRRIRGQNTQVPQPHAAYSYGRYMGGVDQFDQLRSKYKTGRCSKKPWKYLLWFLVDAAAVNSFILHKNATRRNLPTKYSNLIFRHELAMGLIGGFSSRERKSVHTPRVNPPIDPNRPHKNVHLNRGARKCSYHSTVFPNIVCKRTVYGCLSCSVHLCKDCHYRYHTR